MNRLLLQFLHVTVVDLFSDDLVKSCRNGIFFLHRLHLVKGCHLRHFRQDILVVRRCDLRTVLPVYLVAVVFSRIMARRNHNSGNAASFTPDNPAAQIANVHTLFNIITTLLLLPFGTQLARISEKLLPDKPQKTTDEERWFEDLLASEHVLGVSVIARKQLNEDISRMLALAASNVETSFLAFEHRDEYELEQIQKREEEIDLYNAQLSRRISRVLAVENSPSEVNALNRMFSIIGNVERIGDHATNIAGYARTMMERRLELSSQASVELADMRTSCMRAVHLICSACCVDFTFAPEQESPDKRGSLTEHDAPAEHISLPQHASLLEQALLLEQDIDSRTARYRSNQIERMRKGKCHVETSILYSEILTDYERIGDHAFNIAQALDKLDEN